MFHDLLDQKRIQSKAVVTSLQRLIKRVPHAVNFRLTYESELAGPDVARSLTELGLIDEYRIYLHPVVLGHGKPYFAGPRPPLRLMAHDRIGEDVIRLTYVPA